MEKTNKTIILPFNICALELFFQSDNVSEFLNIFSKTCTKRHRMLLLRSITEPYHLFILKPASWITLYNDVVFYQLFRRKKTTFEKLVKVMCTNDKYCLLTKKYRGGNRPVEPEKAVLIVLWYLSKQDTTISIANRFFVVPSTVMRIVNGCLYIIISLKQKYIFFPKTLEEQNYVKAQFKVYPDVIGAVDGTHIRIKVPKSQQDSYTDRYLNKSINLMAICTAKNLLTYIFVGFPGSAHDSRVFASSGFFKNIETYGKRMYFLEDNHLIGDSAFPIKSWLMTPYKDSGQLTNRQKYHNYCLSTDRVCIEHTFGILKGRWRRLQWINTYSVSKAVEIATAVCILHNYCILSNDLWEEEIIVDSKDMFYPIESDNREERMQRQDKRDRIAESLTLQV